VKEPLSGERRRQSADESDVRVTFSFARVDGAWNVVAYQSTNMTDQAGERRGIRRVF